MGISVFPEAFLALLQAVDPVVPDTLPLVFIDEPVLVPLIPVVEPPLVVCASANVLESAKAVASASSIIMRTDWRGERESWVRASIGTAPRPRASRRDTSRNSSGVTRKKSRTAASSKKTGINRRKRR